MTSAWKNEHRCRVGHGNYTCTSYHQLQTTNRMSHDSHVTIPFVYHLLILVIGPAMVPVEVLPSITAPSPPSSFCKVSNVSYVIRVKQQTHSVHLFRSSSPTPWIKWKEQALTLTSTKPYDLTSWSPVPFLPEVQGHTYKCKQMSGSFAVQTGRGSLKSGPSA